jgi:adenosine deaminase
VSGRPARSAVGLNLHTHLEGTVRPGTAAELAASLGVPTPSAGWERAMRMRQAGTLTTFLGHVAAAYPLFATPESVGRIVAEAVEDAALDGVAYLELRFGPATHAGARMNIAEVVEAAAAGLHEGTRRSGLPAGLVVCALRHHEPHVNEEVARAASSGAGRGVVGFDVAGDELLYPSVEPMVRPFRIAAAAGLGLTAHAGEAGDASHVRQAVDRLGVRRIGHGIRGADDAEMLRWAADEAICFEQCPTSNLLTGAVRSYAEHPVRTLLAAGCPVVIGDDDPTTTGVSLSAEFRILEDRIGLGVDELERIHLTSVERAFCDESLRPALGRAMALGRRGAGSSVASTD